MLNSFKTNKKKVVVVSLLLLGLIAYAFNSSQVNDLFKGSLTGGIRPSDKYTSTPKASENTKKILHYYTNPTVSKNICKDAEEDELCLNNLHIVTFEVQKEEKPKSEEKPIIVVSYENDNSIKAEIHPIDLDDLNFTPKVGFEDTDKTAYELAMFNWDGISCKSDDGDIECPDGLYTAKVSYKDKEYTTKQINLISTVDKLSNLEWQVQGIPSQITVPLQLTEQVKQLLVNTPQELINYLVDNKYTLDSDREVIGTVKPLISMLPNVKQLNSPEPKAPQTEGLNVDKIAESVNKPLVNSNQGKLSSPSPSLDEPGNSHTELLSRLKSLQTTMLKTFANLELAINTYTIEEPLAVNNDTIQLSINPAQDDLDSSNVHIIAYLKSSLQQNVLQSPQQLVQNPVQLKLLQNSSGNKIEFSNESINKILDENKMSKEGVRLEMYFIHSSEMYKPLTATKNLIHNYLNSVHKINELALNLENYSKHTLHKIIVPVRILSSEEGPAADPIQAPQEVLPAAPQAPAAPQPPVAPQPNRVNDDRSSGGRSREGTASRIARCAQHFAGDWAQTPEQLKPFVCDLYHNDIITGSAKSGTHYIDAGASVDRAQVATVIFRLQGNMPAPPSNDLLARDLNTRFADMSRFTNNMNECWFCFPIYNLSRSGQFRGFTINGRQHAMPLNPANQVEAAKLALELVHKVDAQLKPNPQGRLFRNDDTQSPWYLGVQRAMSNIGLPSENTPANRAYLIVLLHQIMNINNLLVK